MSCCKSCVFSRWVLTPNGRIKARESGRCTYPLPHTEIVPDSMTRPEVYRTVVWPEEGSECPCYQQSQEKPRPIDKETPHTGMAKLNFLE